MLNAQELILPTKWYLIPIVPFGTKIRQILCKKGGAQILFMRRILRGLIYESVIDKALQIHQVCITFIIRSVD